MKKILILMFIALCSVQANAQAMSDKAVIEYAKNGVNQGKSQKQLYQELLLKGVTKDQMLRIKEEYERQQAKTNEVRAEQKADTQRVNPEKRDDSEKAQNNNMREAAPVGNIKVFGRDIFNNSNLTFEPSLNIATPVDYRLGPGDQLVIEVWGASQANITQKVTPDGYSFLSRINDPVFTHSGCPVFVQFYKIISFPAG